MKHFAAIKEAENFVDTADLSEYDLSGFKPMRFEIAKKESVMNIRLPTSLLDAIRDKSKQATSIPYARYVRMCIWKNSVARFRADFVGNDMPNKSLRKTMQTPVP